VFRSFTGAPAGANGGGYYLTAGASARVDVHERLHIAATRTIHNSRISPLEVRIAARVGQANALSQGATKAEAIAALQAAIDWNTAVTGFGTDETTQNSPGGTVDTIDKNSGTYIQDVGQPRRGYSQQRCGRVARLDPAIADLAVASRAIQTAKL
jgi:hypothetical protein